MTRIPIEPLPARPNYEQQQKRAKHLLRDAWAGDAAAIARIRAFHPAAVSPETMRLHDAQLVIARGYGFTTWVAMKERIESLTKTPLEQFDAAVRQGNATVAHALLTQHRDVRAALNLARFDFNTPAIHQAKKHVPLVDVLLELGADINARSTWWAGGFGILEHDVTLAEARPLIDRGAVITGWAAAGLGLFDELRALLDADPSLVHARGGDGKTPLHCAATVAIAELLLDRGADIDARDVDHASTPLQYLIRDEAIARLLLTRGATPDLFAAARLGDAALVEACLGRDPRIAAVNHPPFTAPGGHIYSWTIGGDTVLDVARLYGHQHIEDLLLARATPRERWLDALWSGDEARVRDEAQQQPDLVRRLAPDDHRLLAAAAWTGRLDSVRLMLDMGFDPHVTGVHRSTPLDRASFHGYADIVSLLLERDPHPPLAFKNEFGGTPLGACIYGSLNGWNTNHPQDHARTVTLLLRAGSVLDPALMPSGHDLVDEVLREWVRTG